MPQPPPDAMAAIGRAVRILAESGDPDAVLVAEGLDRWRRSRSASLEAAAGWASNVRATSMQRARDEALRRLGRRFPGKRGHPLARAVYQLLHEYETTAWPRDRDAHHRPDAEAGDCFDVLINGSLCEGYLRTILAQLAD
jgi:hypothetical protein